MDFNLTPQQQERVEAAREFTREWISPNAAAHDRSGEFPLAICREAFKRGLMNSHIPTEYGGGGPAFMTEFHQVNPPDVPFPLREASGQPSAGPDGNRLGALIQMLEWAGQYLQ